jgi:hypothetical protein
MPAVLDALARSYGVDLSTYLSPYGVTLTTADRNECIGDFNGSVPGLTIQKLLKPEYQNILEQPAFVDILNKLIMGSEPGHPAGPLFMAVGNDPSNAQGQGDDIMVTDDVIALAHEYCQQGVTVQFSEYANANHEEAALEFEPNATAFLEARFAGVTPPTNDCATIATGNSLAPILLAPAASSAATTVASAGITSTAKKVTARKADSRATTKAAVVVATGTLAYTGESATAALIALTLTGLSLGALALRPRRLRRDTP